MKFQLALFAFALVLVSTTFAEEQRVKICEPKSVFMDDCNRCRCSDDGYDKSCTRIMCVKKPGSEAGKTKRDAELDDLTCVPGSQFQISCHDCICTSSGLKASAVCTLEVCPDEIHEISKRDTGDSRYCIPGSTFKLDCNVCICPSSGMREGAACTLKGCLGIQGED